jgi:hypothetical protein
MIFICLPCALPNKDSWTVSLNLLLLCDEQDGPNLLIN